MSGAVERDTLFVGLTRPQMFAGVTYSLFVANIVLATEMFLIFKSLWVIAAAVAFHVLGVLLCLNDMTIFVVGVACSFGAGALLDDLGWVALNRLTLPWLGLAALALIWHGVRGRSRRTRPAA